MFDSIQKLDHSVVQHGPFNNRIYLMKMAKEDYPGIISNLEKLAIKNNYTKIFAKVPGDKINAFMENDYIREARIPGFFAGDEEVAFVSRFIDHERSALDPKTREHINKNLEIAASKKESMTLMTFPEKLQIRLLGEADVPALTKLYRLVFKTYPFPIHNPDYLRQTMAENIIYFGAYSNDQLVAASSAETDLTALNAEMTDFATLPDYRGNNLSLMLLKEMEALMRQRRFRTVYTIARALSPGMNVTFAKMGYMFGGTLINNTQISGKIESMNVWYKSLQD